MAVRQKPQNPAPPDPPRRRLPLALLLVGGMTLLILLSVGSVLFISLREATENTFSLLADRADSNLDLLEAQLETQLAPVEAAGTELAARIGADAYRLESDDEALRHMLRGALASLPRATAVIFVTPQAEALRIARVEGVIGEVPENDFLRQRQVEAIERAARMTRPAWLEPTWMPALNEPILSFIAPVRRNGRFAGTVVVSTRLGELARFLKTIETEKGVRAFILYDSRYVLGHPELLDQGADLSGGGGAVALPTVETFHEDAFRLLQEEAQRAESLLRRSRFDDAPVDEEFIVLIREIRRYGAVPWQIALRFRQAEVTVELDRLRDAAIVGFGILLLAVATGYFVTRNLNRQIGRLAATANRLRELDVADLEPLPDSRLRELAHAARAFNALIAAMRWFETYVPKALVHRLMQASDRAMHSDERTLTILFTDIRGFSTQVEHMSPVETADFLNRHFALLADCVEAEDGTVDKFIGDSIMAFWGAPEDQPDHAARALRAALAMRAALDAENARRHAAGEVTTAIRIGIHSGPVVVGNIGSRNRLNYTVIGDTVNVAARLEAFAKELTLDDDCIAVISRATLQAAGGAPPAGASVEQLGAVPVRGRVGKVDAYMLRR